MFQWRRRRERGATLVEAALAFPILILVIISILELGMAFKDYLTVSYLSREAARIGALAGNDPLADCAILLGIESLATEGDLRRLDTVRIYRADSRGNELQGPNTGSWRDNGNAPKCSNPNAFDDTWTVNSSAWAPTSREVGVGQDMSPDIIGVQIRLTRNWITGFPPFNGTFTIDERTITRLEPKAFYPTP
jgi:Flp pilus assembly protein TadG